jgi:replicative DNA helicase
MSDTTPNGASPNGGAPLRADVVVLRTYLQTLYGTAERGFLPIWRTPGTLTDWVPISEADTAVAMIRQRCDEGYNVYHGMGLHPKALGPGQRGTAAGVIALPGFYMDADLHDPRAHADAALPETVEDVEHLLQDFPLQPSLLIHSGHGLYPHWLFHEVLTIESDQERARVASALRLLQGEIRRLGREHGWTFDATQDLARVLRPPGVVNRKVEDAPVLTRVLSARDVRYSLEEIESVLPDDGASSHFAKGAGWEESEERQRATTPRILEECAFLAHCRDDAKTLPEPQWHAMLSVVALCDDGRQAAHDLSKPYPGYKPEETKQKYAAARKADKPIKCTTVEETWGDAWCRTCEHRRRITSPIQLGYPQVRSSGGNGASEPPPWEEPDPLPVHEQPEFPTHQLPERIRAWVTSLARATQTPDALAAMTTIGVIQTTVSRNVEVGVRDGWREPGNGYNLVVLPSGNRKSAVTDAVGAPLIAIEHERTRAMAPDIARARAKRDVVEKRLDRLKREQARNAVDDLALDADIRTTVDELSSEGLTVPVAPRYLVDDVTPEKLADLMGEHGERMGVLSPEGGIFQVIAGRYSDGKTDGLDLFLKGHSGDYLPIDRIGRSTKHLQRPALTLTIAVQPEVLAGLARHPGFRGLGLLARLAYAVPVSTVGRRRIAAPPVPHEVRHDYATLIEALLTLPGPAAGAASHSVDSVYEFQPIILTLSPAAAGTLMAFEAWLEPQLAQDEGALGDIADWGSKLAGLVARWAGIFHSVAHVQPGKVGEPSMLDSLEIEEETLARVVDIAKTFLIPHARTAFAMMGADRSEGRARRILEVVRGWKKDTITRRDIHQHTRRSIPDVNDLDRQLAVLEEHGYVRRLPIETAGAGRKPSPTFAINPRWRTAAPASARGQDRDDVVDRSHDNTPRPKTSTEYTELEKADDNTNSMDSVYGFPGSQQASHPDQEGSPPPGEWTHRDDGVEPPSGGHHVPEDTEVDHKEVERIVSILRTFTAQDLAGFRAQVANPPDGDPHVATDREALERFDRERGSTMERAS